MAEEASDGRLVAFKLVEALGANKAGEVIHLPEDVGNMLVEMGKAELASSEDMGGDVAEEEAEGEYADAPVLANSASRLAKQVENKAAEIVAKQLTKSRQYEAPTVPAEYKTGPIYKTAGHMIRGLYKALYKGDKTEANRCMAYQEEAAKSWSEQLGVQVKAPLGINETTTTQGGFLVNNEFSSDVYVIPHGQIDLLSMCPSQDAKSNVLLQRYVNESSLANSSIYGGLNMVATGEGASLTSSLPAWNSLTFTLQKFAIFNYYTTEVLEDASYPVESELNEYIAKAFIYGLNVQVIQGSTLEGALNAPSAVTVTKSSNDTSYTSAPSTVLTYADLSNIWSRVYSDSQTSPKGVWLFHPSLQTALTQMTYTFSGSNPAWGIQYTAEDGLSGQGPTTPYRIFGKPAYPCWAMSAPGAAGDIAYIDFGTFLHYRKPFRVEISKEFQFGTDQVAVRAVNRLDCKTKFRNKVTGPTGSDNFGPIVMRSSAGT